MAPYGAHLKVAREFGELNSILQIFFVSSPFVSITFFISGTKLQAAKNTGFAFV